MSVTWGKTHPVYVERGAVTPRNYQPSRFTSEDTHDVYTRKAMRSGKTIHDLLSEAIEAKLRLSIHG